MKDLTPGFEVASSTAGEDVPPTYTLLNKFLNSFRLN